MTAMSRYLEDALINAIFNGIAYTFPASVYVGLNTAAGDETTPTWIATELDPAVATGYARVEAPSAVWQGSVGGGTSNTDTVTFPVAAADWGTVTHVTLWDAATAGNLLFKTELLLARIVANGDQVAFPLGNLNVQLR